MSLKSQNTDHYSRVQLMLSSPSYKELLLQCGIHLENCNMLKNNTFIAELSHSEIQTLENLNISFEVLIHNLSDYYQSSNQNISIDSINEKIKNHRKNKSIPCQFNLGSIGGRGRGLV